MKKRAVVVGLEYHARLLARTLNTASSWRLRQFSSSRLGTVRTLLACRNADVLICFGGPGPSTAITQMARQRNMLVAVIWAGSDVLKARENPFHLELVKQERFVHFAVAPWLVDELRELGIQAEYVPVSAVRAGKPVRELPKAFSVLTYLPEPRRDFYGAELVYELARSMPDVQFKVIGEGTVDPRAPGNVKFFGAVADTDTYLDDATVLLRHPDHDGQSLLVLEALARARHVVWNYPMPHVHCARGFDAVRATLIRLKETHDAGELAVNSNGRAFVLQEFSAGRVAGELERLLDSQLEQWRRVSARPRRRVAITGLSLFCAEIRKYGKLYAPEWETVHLRSNSRLDVIASIIALASCDVWYSIGHASGGRWMDIAARVLRKPRVVHWVGSDICWLLADPTRRKMFARRNVTHLAEVGWTSDELSSAGLKPRIAPLPPRHRDGVPVPLPQKFTVLLYVPKTRADFYGRAAFERLMENMRGREIRYVIVGGGEIAIPAGVDAVNLGWRIGLKDLYEDASALIRFTARDGLSLMVLEALSFGRYVLWTQPFPPAQMVREYADIEREINVLYDKHVRGELRPQAAASAMIAQQYGVEQCMRTIASAWADALETPQPPRLAVQTP